MKLSWQGFIHALLIGASVGTAVSGALPPQQQLVVSGAAHTLQLIVSLVAQHFNTDGTPQEKPYVAPAVKGQ